MKQMVLDFSLKPIANGKKTERLAIPCSEEYLAFLDLLAKLHNSTRAELAFSFVLEGMQKSLGSAFIFEPYLEKTLHELMPKS